MTPEQQAERAARRDPAQIRARWVQVFPDHESAALAAASFIAGRIRRVGATHRRFRLALSAHDGALSMLVRLRATELAWTRVEIYLVGGRGAPSHGDERQRAAFERVLGHSGATLHENAVDADEPLASDVRDQTGLPRLNLAHLGLSADGHGSGIFPVGGALEVSGRDAVISSSTERAKCLTLLDQAIDRADEPLVLVTGPTTAVALEKLCRGDRELSSALRASRRLRIVADECAARLLEEHPLPDVVLWRRTPPRLSPRGAPRPASPSVLEAPSRTDKLQQRSDDH